MKKYSIKDFLAWKRGLIEEDRLFCKQPIPYNDKRIAELWEMFKSAYPDPEKGKVIIYED
jgi:hypothetical protein